MLWGFLNHVLWVAMNDLLLDILAVNLHKNYSTKVRHVLLRDCIVNNLAVITKFKCYIFTYQFSLLFYAQRWQRHLILLLYFCVFRNNSNQNGGDVAGGSGLLFPPSPEPKGRYICYTVRLLTMSTTYKSHYRDANLYKWPIIEGIHP